MGRAAPFGKLQGGWGEGEATRPPPGAAVMARPGQHSRGPGTTAAPAGVCGAGGRVGYCDVTEDGPSDCATDHKGSWPLHKKNGSDFAEQCQARCKRCANCRYVSVSQARYRGAASACKWFSKCTSGPLHIGPTTLGGETYTTFVVRRKKRTPTWYD